MRRLYGLSSERGLGEALVAQGDIDAESGVEARAGFAAAAGLGARGDFEAGADVFVRAEVARGARAGVAAGVASASLGFASAAGAVSEVSSAFFTRILCSPKTFPLSIFIAALPCPGLGISTKPKPLDKPLLASITKLHDCTAP